MKYKSLAETTYVNDIRFDIKKHNEILAYVVKHSDISPLRDNSFEIMLNDGVYEIYAETLYLEPNDEEFKYPIRYCDEFNLRGNKIKSFKNLPQKPYKFSTIDYCFEKCNSLDFRDFEISSDVHNSIIIKNTKNVNPNHLPPHSQHVRFLSCTGDVLYDFQKYDVYYTSITLGLAAKLKNVQYVLHTRLLRCSFSLATNVYTYDEIRELDSILKDFMGRNNREEYIMDMTLILIEQGFEDEV